MYYGTMSIDMHAFITTTKAKFSVARRHWLTVAFLLGFLLDTITLNRVDQKFDNFVLSSYVILAMVGITLLYAGIAERFSEKLSHFLRNKAPFLIQYAFGGLLSGMLIFYGRSGAFYESWPFLLMILAVIYGNETVKDRATRLVYNLTIFFVGMFAYVVLIIPVVLGKMGALVFVGSGFVALLIMYWFFRLLTLVVPNFISLQRQKVVFTIGIVYATFNFLYFTNIIPPIPLSLKEVGIYHSVVRFDNDTYQLSYEKPEWWEYFRDSDKNFHAADGDDIFCYASVFAPTRLATKVYHRWEYFDETENVWKNHGDRLSYAISGGRGEGFRGYTMITNYREGKWRCVVETERGQSLGRETFTVTRGEKGELVTIIE